jgi:hypothetical protein
MMSIFLALVIRASVALAVFSTPSAVKAEPDGTWGPDRALTPTGDWDPLSAGESQWYAFQYAGDGSQIEVRFEVVPEGSSTFVVWTPEQIWHWGLGEYVEPVGRGSEDPRVKGTLVWSGNFPTSGTYYVVVEHADTHAGASHYLLDVSGNGVSLSKPTPASAPAKTQTGTRAQTTPPGDPTGKLVFQTTFGGTFHAIKVDGTGLQPVTHGIDPVWSPDGQQIAFVRWEDPRGVWVVGANGANVSGGERRVFDWHETRWPSWSPDGEQIVFSRQHRGRREPTEKCVVRTGRLFCFTRPPNPHYNLGVVRLADGSFWEPLPSSSERSLTPDWSPHGEQIVYEDVYGLFVQSADGQTRYQLTNDNKDTSPVWSPDGAPDGDPSGGQVAFVRRQHDHWEIYVVDSDGRNLTRLTDTPTLPNGTPGNSVSPAWSPDGQYIAFLTDRTGEWEIWVMTANGSSQRPMFDTELDGLTLEYSFNGERAISWTR